VWKRLLDLLLFMVLFGAIVFVTYPLLDYVWRWWAGWIP
jgi:hypothetical protein